MGGQANKHKLSEETLKNMKDPDATRADKNIMLKANLSKQGRQDSRKAARDDKNGY